MHRPERVPQDRPPEVDLLDLALDRGARALDDDPVALEVRPLDQDQEPHQVVEDDGLAGQRQRGDDDADAGDQLPEVEHGEDEEHEREEEQRPGQLVQDVLERDRPLLQLLGRCLAGHRRLLDVEDADDEAVDEGLGEPIQPEEDHRPDREGDPVGRDPAHDLVERHASQ